MRDDAVERRRDARARGRAATREGRTIYLGCGVVITNRLRGRREARGGRAGAARAMANAPGAMTDDAMSNGGRFGATTRERGELGGGERQTTAARFGESVAILHG